MPTTKETQTRIDVEEPCAGVERSGPGGRAQRDAGAARSPHGPSPAELPLEVRDRLSDELIDELLAGAQTEEEIVGPGGLLSRLTKRLVERALDVELTDHLGYERGQAPPGGAGNARNGTTSKTLATEHGPLRIEAPRDRKGSFQPKIVRKRQRRLRDSTTRSWPYIRAVCRSGISRRTSRRSTASRSAAI
jgi:mutator family transposase